MLGKNNLPLGYSIFVILLTLFIPFISLQYFIILFLILIIIVFLSRHHIVDYYFSLMSFSGAALLMGIIILILGDDFQFPIYVLSASVAITCVGNATASYIRTKVNIEDELDEKLVNATSSIALTIIGALSAFLIAYWTISWMNLDVALNQLFFLVLIGALTGALLEVIPSKTNKNLTMMLGAGMVMWMFASFGYYVNFIHLSIAFIFSLFLSFLAYRQNIADVSAMLAAIILGVLIIVFTNINWYLILISFFLLGGAFTRYKYDYKLTRGIAQSKGGLRSYDNVFSNSITALILAVGYGVYDGSNVLLFAYLGAVATATGDTLASEIGETYIGKPVMITTFEPVRPGTDGGISMLGELVCIGGSLITGILALVLGVIDIAPTGISTYIFWIFIVVLGGFVGTNFDSLLGATMQQKGWLSNSGVNLVATMGGAFISGAAYYLTMGM